MLELMGGIVNCRVSPSRGWFESSKGTEFRNGNSVYSLSSINSKTGKRNNYKTKTVYLIRHAESNENRRLESLSRSLQRVAKMQLPYKDDVAASVELLNVQAQLDSFVSKKGEQQIHQLAKKLAADDFIKQKGIKLVAHSPLIRARQTSEGMLGCVTSRTASTVEGLWEGKKDSFVERVVELPFLVERTPVEWLPINHEKFQRRVDEFEQWLSEQPEEKIAVVGHSNYFKGMLDLPYKFGNCDVWEVKFKPVVRTLVHLGPKVNVNGDTVQTMQEAHAHEIETIHSDAEEEECLSEEKSNRKLPRGWHNLVNLYSFEE